MKELLFNDHSPTNRGVREHNDEFPELSSDTNNSPEPRTRIYSEFPLTFYGGGERLIIEIYKYFKLNSISAKIIDNNAKISEERIKREDLINVVGSDLVSTAFCRYGFPSFLYQDLPALKDLTAPSNDISLILSRRFPPRRILQSLSMSKNKFVFCLHGIALEKFRLVDVRLIAHQIIIRLQLRYFSRYVRKNIYVQTLTPLIASYLIENDSDKNNIFVIENEFDSEITEIKENTDSFRVIFIGRMQNITKGIRFLRKVIRIVNRSEPNIKFIVIGNGPDLYILDKIRGEATILDSANDEIKGLALQSSSLAIITSNLEPFPRVAQEFLTAGIPVLTTPVSGPAYILGKNAVFGKVSSFDPKLFSKDIITYYQEWKNDKQKYSNRRKEIAISSKNIFLEKHMLERYLKMVLEINSK